MQQIIRKMDAGAGKIIPTAVIAIAAVLIVVNVMPFLADIFGAYSVVVYSGITAAIAAVVALLQGATR